MIKGVYDLVLTRKDGSVEKLHFENIVPNTGLAAITALLAADVGGTGFDYMALGTDDTAAAAAQTALLAEISTNGGERTAGTGTQQTTTTTNDTFRLIVSWNFTGTLQLREIGVFNGPAAGDMLSRQTMNLDVGNGDSLQGTYDFVIARA